MFLRVYYEDSNPSDANSTLEMAVKTCSQALLAVCYRYGKSPCFWDVAFLRLLGPDYPSSILPCVDGAENMECVFWYGK
jgi:hypothetical protein